MGSLLSWGKHLPISNRHSHNPFLSLQSELDKAMREFYQTFETPEFSKEFSTLSINPSIDIIEDERSFKVEVEMPGLAEEDIKVSITDGTLIIKAEKKTSKKDEGKNYVMREIGYGSYERNVALPEFLDTDKAVATFKKGMLWVDIPKKAEAVGKPKEIKVEKAKE